MEENNYIKSIQKNIEMVMGISKCRKCGCLKEALETIKSELLNCENNDLSWLLNQVESSINEMELVKYN